MMDKDDADQSLFVEFGQLLAGDVELRRSQQSGRVEERRLDRGIKPYESEWSDTAHKRERQRFFFPAHISGPARHATVTVQL